MMEAMISSFSVENNFIGNELDRDTMTHPVYNWDTVVHVNILAENRGMI